MTNFFNQLFEGANRVQRVAIIVVALLLVFSLACNAYTLDRVIKHREYINKLIEADAKLIAIDTMLIEMDKELIEDVSVLEAKCDLLYEITQLQSESLNIIIDILS